jgi:hypothetical protein
MSPLLKKRRREMKLVSFLKRLGIEGEAQERLLKEVTRYFGLLPTQFELLRMNKKLDVYPLYYPEYSKSLVYFFDTVFNEDNTQLLIFDIFRTLYLLQKKEVKNV